MAMTIWRREDGAAAVDAAAHGYLPLLLDLMMPGMDGFDVLRVMKYHAWLDEHPGHRHFGGRGYRQH